MTILRIARKTLLEYWREPQLILFILLGPAALVGLWYAIYAPAKDHLSDFLHVLAVNHDAGPAGEALIESLRAIEFDGQSAVNLHVLDEEDAGLNSLFEGKAALMIIIPQDFSNRLAQGSLSTASGDPPAVEYWGDTASFNYVFAKGFIDPYVRGFIRIQSGLGLPKPVAYEFLPGTGTSADFDVAVPGLLVFSLMFLIISSASTLVNEQAHSTLTRFRLARITGLQMVLGVGAAQMVLALAEVAVGFITAVALGYGHGTAMLEPVRILLLLAISLLFSVPVVGMGLMTAAFSRTDGEAASLGSLILVPLAFLSGILFPMPAVPLFTWGNRAIGFFDLFPTTLAVESIRQAVVLGDLSAVAFPIAGLIVESVLIVLAGSWIYQRRRLRQRDA